MKINRVSGITRFSKNLARTDELYEALGFETGKRDRDRMAGSSKRSVA